MRARFEINFQKFRSLSLTIVQHQFKFYFIQYIAEPVKHNILGKCHGSLNNTRYQGQT